MQTSVGTGVTKLVDCLISAVEAALKLINIGGGASSGYRMDLSFLDRISEKYNPIYYK